MKFKYLLILPILVNLLVATDTDSDGVSDEIELSMGTNPNNGQEYDGLVNESGQFSYAFNLYEDWTKYLIESYQAEVYTEVAAGNSTFWRPTVQGEEGYYVYQIPIDGPIVSAMLKAHIYAWTEGSDANYDQNAYAHLEVSSDGETWHQVDNMSAGVMAQNDVFDISDYVTGASDVFVRSRLLGNTLWPTDGLIFAQSLRTSNSFASFMLVINTDPNNADSDGDGLSDSVETNTGIYVSETNTGTDPNNPDSDGDGISDSVETNTGIYVSATDTGTDPNNADSDGDGLSDGLEVHRLRAVIGEFTWHEARLDAEMKGGHLVTISSKEENDKVTTLIPPIGPPLQARPSAWIGATDELVEGVWQWVTGESFEYQNWYNYPDNYQGVEHYAHIGWPYGGDQWQDYPVTVALRAYILEIEYSTDPNNADTDGDGVPDGLELTEGTDPNNADSFNTFSTGLVAYYSFENFNDHAGDLIFTPQNETSLVDGPWGKAFRIVGNDTNDATGGYGQIDLPSDFPATGVTYSFWIYEEAYPGGWHGEHFLDRSSDGFGHQWMRNADDPEYGQPGIMPNYAVTGNENEVILPTNDGIDYQNTNSDFSLIRKGWRHYTVVADPGGTKFYVDGNLKLTSVKSYSQVGSLRLGYHDYGSGIATRLTARYDNLRIYNKLLSAEEASDLFYSEAPQFQIIEGRWDNLKTIQSDSISRGGSLAILNSTNKHQDAINVLSQKWVNAGFESAAVFGLSNDGNGWTWASGQTLAQDNFFRNGEGLDTPPTVAFLDSNTADWIDGQISEQSPATYYILEASPQFQIIEGNFTWQEAVADAEARGGRLAVLNTQGKIDAAQSFLDDLGQWPEFYIGLTDQDNEGDWRWIDGTILSASNWTPGEPGNSENITGQEDFVVVVSSNDPNNAGKWGDNSAYYFRDYIDVYTSDVGGYLLELLPNDSNSDEDYTMYGINHDTDSLVSINLESGDVSTIGSLGIDVGPFTGLDYDPSSRKLITALSPPGGYSNLYEINLSTGTATNIKSIEFSEQVMEDDGVNWLGFSASGTLYAWNERYAFNTGDFWLVDTATGTSTKIADSSLPSVLGADYQEGVGYWISDEWNGTIYRVDELTGSIEFTGTSNIWFTGNGPGDLHDLDYAPDDVLRVAASDSSIQGSTLLIINQDNGLEESRLNLSESILSIASVPNTAIEAPAFLTFTLNGDSTYSVTDCLETTSGSLDIPITYNGLPVTSIGDSAFKDCIQITSITIPDSVISIGNGAFVNCTSLSSITIPDSVTSIGVNAFSYCTSLTSVTIPDSVKSIRVGVFSHCANLTSITIPNSVTSIRDHAFSSCSSLSSITIPGSVKSIGKHAFSSCTSLTSITIPDSVTSIGNYAFYGCSSLSSITIPDSVTSIGVALFYSCSSLSSITIPDGVTSIGTSAFYSCTSLASITIPDSVTSIGRNAFGNTQGSISFSRHLLEAAEAERDARLTMDEVRDARVGSTMIEVSDGKADITMTLEETSNLSDWSNATTSEKTIEVEAPAGIRFYRFKMAE